ncbi:MAG TPA: GvpL/GvpF family gas vesicle protein, partial [Solirubrobacteraceae bacterium]|nr:GvpL/GvpF family gas vesicle protein [Solirubrobacteraceae bacterium]
AEELHDPLSELAADARCSLLPADDTAFAAAYLVERERADELEGRARELAQQHPEVDMVVSGPWPPYSFSELPDA